MNPMAMRPGIIILREGTDTSQVRFDEGIKTFENRTNEETNDR
jgi:hypothetical protein